VADMMTTLRDLVNGGIIGILAKGGLIMNLTLEEWRQYLGDEPYRKTCANVPR